MHRGYIRLYRRIQEHELWKDKPFAPGLAWVDLLILANHDSCTVEYPQSYLGKRWGWSQPKVSRFIKYLVGQGMVEILSSGKVGERVSGVNKEVNKVYICNYLHYHQPVNKGVNKDSEYITNTIINNTLKEQIYIVGNHWNKKGIIHHGPKTIENCMSILKRHLLAPYGTGDYWTDDICNAICNYERVLNGKEYFWTHRWTLKEFLQRGVDRFVDEAEPLTNFLKQEQQRRFL